MHTEPTQDQLDILANLYHSGQISDQILLCKELLKTHEKSLILYNILGSALQTTGKLHEAIETYNKAIQIYPNYADAHYNLGNALKELNRDKEAIKSYKKTIQIEPGYVDAYNNLGAIFQELGLFNEAVRSYNNVIQLEPGYVNAYQNLGVVFQELDQLDESINNLNKAIQLNPEYVEAYNSLGLSLQKQGKFYQAIENYHKAIHLDPKFSDSYNNIGVTFQELGQLDKAIDYYNKAIHLEPKSIETYQNLLMNLSYDSRISSGYALEVARKFGELVAKRTLTRFSDYQESSAPKRLRVGFVSGDFINHPVGYFLESIVSNIDPNKIELIAYPTRNFTDDLSDRIKPFFSKWESIAGQSDKAAANIIHDDRIHILVDLSGHTAYNRLPVFGYRPAPIQISWLGYWATTGLNEIDYFLGDPHVTPAEYDHHFVEKVWRLPETRFCFTPPNINTEVEELPASKNGYITFGCFNNLTKMNNEVLELWSKVLKSVPNSRLLLKAKQFNDESVCEDVMYKFSDQGVDVNRITLEKAVDRGKYFLTYNRIDITLDPFPFTGGTTSAESLWMGVPIITLSGDSLVSRQGVGILMNAGLPNWIANNEKEYVYKASHLSSNLDELSKLRARLREQALTSPLFDAQLFAKKFEESLWSMWEEYLQK